MLPLERLAEGRLGVDALDARVDERIADLRILGPERDQALAHLRKLALSVRRPPAHDRHLLRRRDVVARAEVRQRPLEAEQSGQGLNRRRDAVTAAHVPCINIEPRKLLASRRGHDEVKKGLAGARFGDMEVIADQLQRLALEPHTTFAVRPDLDAHPYGKALEEEGDRHVKQFGDDVQPARADPVLAGLVFVKLLKGDTNCLCNLLLAQAEHGTAEPEVRPDVLIDRPPLFRRVNTSFSSRHGGGPPTTKSKAHLRSHVAGTAIT